MVAGRSDFSMSIRRQHRGYVLVVTLALLVLCATLTAATARMAMRRALAARLAESELQHRWGMASCRAALLPHAEQILTAAELRLHRPHRPLAVYSTRVQLGRQRFDLILGDEQAKANVNALLERDGRENAQTRLRQALSGTGLAAKLLLRPDPAISVAATQPTTAPANVS